MNQIIYPLNQHKPINHWLVAGTFEEEKSFKKITMDFTGDLNRWLTEGFAVFENPNRKEFIEAELKVEKQRIDISEVSPGRSLSYQSSTKTWQLYFPWKNKKIEQSGFWQQPTHLQSWAITNIRSNKAQKATFKLFTCGSVNLWVNGEKVLQFSPYTRNEEKNIGFEVLLREGDNEFLVLSEDLAERDTLFYFRVDYLGTEDLEMVLPIGDTSSEDIHLLEEALKNAYFPSDVLTSGEVSLYFENPLAGQVQLECEFKTEWWGEKKELNRIVQPNCEKVILGEVEELGMGNVLLSINIRYQTVVLQKNMFLQLYPENLVPQDVSDYLHIRKQQASSFIAKYGKKDIHRAYLLAKAGDDLELVELIVRDTLQVINARFDCSDFYFNQLFRFWADFHDTGLFEESLWEECKQTILNYRYWFDEPGDDVMWFFSENHALLFHTCEYLAGQLFPDEIFPNANILGSVHVERAKVRLKKWFEKFNDEGLAEWNSSAYIPINVMGFLQVYDLVNDLELKSAAEQALDTTFRLMALNCHNGYLSCSHGRIYEKELKGNYNNATTSLLWIAYGKGNLNNSTFAAAALSMSEYEPPDYRSLIGLSADENVVFKHHQGTKGFVDLYTYKNRFGLLSSAVEYRPGGSGYSEHVVHSTLSPEAIVWINHPGEETELGTGRPSFWAGNGQLPKVDQYHDIAFIHYRIDPESEIDYTHAYFPLTAFEQVEITGNWCFGKIRDSYIALYAKNGLILQTEGQNKKRELISIGRENKWILRNSHVQQFASFSQFITSIKNAELKHIGEEFIFHDPIHGKAQSSWKGPFTVNGVIQLNSDQQTEGVLEKWSFIQN
ncbi:hypothetical protein PH210_23265 [Paenibacillus sp. BSR1-1]|uniref:hypothetical protein n=1 Tax=Paenibacillus sp. BSR1-1 TaxID=3020845 RepID=UPI0025B0EAF0|nr:hypothetical protein [Paenibacillus sp. BSR1-1]MDN3019096.1 hypothetical protein [Paenibacillus sp. BSR1-1]